MQRCGTRLARLLLASATISCATFAELGPETSGGLPDPRSLSVSVAADVVRLNNSNQRVPDSVSLEYYRDQVARALRECDCFASVDLGNDASELDAAVRMSFLIHNKSALLNLATVLLVPAVEDRRISVEVTLRDRATGAETRAERTRDFRVWYQTFLLPIYPFKSPAAFESRLVRALVRNAVVDATTQLAPRPAAADLKTPRE